MMKKAWIFSSLTALTLIGLGCDPKEGGSEGQIDSSSGQPSETTGSTDDTDTPPTTDDPEDTETAGGSSSGDIDPGSDTEPECNFLGCPVDTDVDDILGCDLWGQDCPGGDKCNPWANDGGSSWNDARCVPVDASPGQPGDPCTVEGNGVSGVDSCDIGSMCWNVDEENNGTCVSLCQGTQNQPLCDNPADECIIANDGALPLCLPQCDPLLGCPDGEGCYPADLGFVCVPDASGPDLGGYGDACAYTNACDPGLFCASAAAVPDCDGASCCSNFCDLSDPQPSANCGGVGGGQECVSAFEEGQALPGLEDVGVCAIPE